MQKLSTSEVESLGIVTSRASNRLSELVATLSVGEGVTISASEWDRKTHPISVIRHRARYRKTSPLYRREFTGKILERKGKEWEKFAIVRKA